MIEGMWSVRPYKDGDEEAILELWKAVYPEKEYDREQWLRWWHWMYKENPVGHGRIWVAEDDGKIVGHYPLIFMMLKVGNQIVKASQNIDQMTHPDYRRQGIALKLGRQALDESEREEVYITIGFANEGSYGVDIKTGWFDICYMQLMVKVFNVENTVRVKFKNKFAARLFATGAKLALLALSRRRKTPFFDGLTITQVSSFDERINEFWTKVSSQFQIMVVRNKDYLNWRYVAIPDVNYLIYIAEKTGQIYGYLVLRCLQQDDVKAGRIFDILAQSEEIAQCLVSKAVEHCEREKVDFIIINGSMIANKIYLKSLRKNGFIAIPFIKGGRFIAYSSSPHISKDFLRNPENWLVQMGDSDTI